MASLQYKTRVDNTFEEQYIAVRKKEGRIYSIEQLKKLPVVPLEDPLYKEWKIRKNSADRLVYYLHKNAAIRNILEIGCGNGWFSNYLAQNTLAENITGSDINEFELQQASVAFDSPKLNWIYADIFTADLTEMKYDLIVLNGAVQYFPDLPKLITKVKELLSKNGEVHILDSPFYNSENELQEAKERTKKYYDQLGFPEMSRNYTPHLYGEAKKLKMEMLFEPSPKLKLISKFTGGVPRPFPWLMWKK